MIYVLFSASSFLTKYIVEHLVASKSNIIRICTTNKNSTKNLTVFGHCGQIQIIEYDHSTDYGSLINKADVVINLIESVFSGSSKKNFFKIHSQIPESIAKECAKQNVKRFIHFSSLGIENNPSMYARSHINGEKAVLAAFSNTSIIRTGLIVDHDSRITRILCCIANMKFRPFFTFHTKLQPISAKNIAEFVVQIIKNDVNGILEIAGPKRYSLNDLLCVMSKKEPKLYIKIPMSYNIAKMTIYILLLPLSYLFTKLISGDYNAIFYIDHINLIYNNALTTKNNALYDVGIKPEYIEKIIIDIYK